jgi:hypothetical protein
VTITVNNINDAPVADNQSVVTEINTAIAIMLTATNPDGDALVFFVQDDPIHGHLSGTGPNLVYTPDQDYFGTDQFTFVVYESGSISSFSQSRDRSTTGTIDITINPVFELFLPLIIQ